VQFTVMESCIRDSQFATMCYNTKSQESVSLNGHGSNDTWHSRFGSLLHFPHKWEATQYGQVLYPYNNIFEHDKMLKQNSNIRC